MPFCVKRCQVQTYYFTSGYAFAILVLLHTLELMNDKWHSEFVIS